jgi:hypothetical protein
MGSDTSKQKEENEKRISPQYNKQLSSIPPSRRSDVSNGGSSTYRSKSVDNQSKYKNNTNETYRNNQQQDAPTSPIGPRISKRELWWQTPEREDKKFVENRRLRWESQSKIDTWGNINHTRKGIIK